MGRGPLGTIEDGSPCRGRAWRVRGASACCKERDVRVRSLPWDETISSSVGKHYLSIRDTSRLRKNAHSDAG